MSFAEAYINGNTESNETIENENVQEVAEVENEATEQENISSENEGEKQEIDNPTSETGEEGAAKTEETPAFSIESFRKLTEGEFESPEDVYRAYKANLQASQDNSPFANDYIKKLNDYAQKGIPITPEFIGQISKDWGAMEINENNAREMLTMKLRLDNPDFDESEISFLMEENYSFDEEKLREELEDKYSDEEKVDSIIAERKERYLKKLTIEAKRARPDLVQHQKALEQPQGKTVEQLEAERESYMKVVKEVVGNLGKIEIPLNDGEKVEVQLGKDLQGKVHEDLKLYREDQQKFWEKHNGLGGLAAMLANHYAKDKIAEGIQARVSNETTLKQVREMRNQKPIGNDAGNQTQLNGQMGNGAFYAQAVDQ